MRRLLGGKIGLWGFAAVVVGGCGGVSPTVALDPGGAVDAATEAGAGSDAATDAAPPPQDGSSASDGASGSDAGTAPPGQGVPLPPAGHAYLGAIVNASQDTKTLETQIEALEKQSGGHHFGMQLTYRGWAGITSAYLASDAQIQGDLSRGRISNLSWACGDSLANIAAASATANGPARNDYQVIQSTADALRAYGHPVLLRFFHEFNLDVNGGTSNGDNPSCFDQTQTMAEKAQTFVAAWENISSIFQTEGASNVSFEWCPNDIVAGPIKDYPTLASFLPPKGVQWIGIDRYDKLGIGFLAMFSDFYKFFAPRGLPLIISETGEVPMGNPSHLPGYNPMWTQSQFFSDIRKYLFDGTFPQIRAVNYFDSTGADVWYLDAGGTAGAIATLQNPAFITP